MFDRLRSYTLLITVMACVGIISLPLSSCKCAASNEQFCSLAMAELADSLLNKLQLEQGGTIQLVPTEEPLGEELTRELAERLHKTGIVVYLGENIVPSDQALKTTINDLSLSYQRQGGGLFSRGKVKRTFSAAVSGTLQWSDGRLAQVISIPHFVKSDILSSQEAVQVRGNSGFLAPEIPLSFQQRILEPSFVVVITGALVYLFFASR